MNIFRRSCCSYSV